MIRFFIYLAFLVCAVFLGLHIKADPGYILLAYSHWTIELPLWLGILIILLTIIAVYWSLRLITYFCSFSGKFNSFRGRRRHRSSNEYTTRGLIDVAEGNFRQAEKNLIKGTRFSDSTLINYLSAAKAAQEQGAYERRDKYLKKAHHANPDAKIAVELTQAQLQLHHQQLERALATLCHLQEIAPKHKYVLKLLKNLYVELNDWKKLAELLPILQKQQVLPDDELKMLEQKTYHRLLSKAEATLDPSIESLWNNLGKHLKSNANLVEIYVHYLLAKQKDEACAKLIIDTLKKDWNSNLIKLFSLIPEADHEKQLIYAESLLRNHSQDYALNLTLGRLCKATQLWGKARSYLEASIKICPSVDAYMELGKLLEHLNETPQALACYRKGLELQY